jgi:hypothetical protein
VCGISVACIVLEKLMKTCRPPGILRALMGPRTTLITLDTLIFRVFHMFNATVTKRNDRNYAKSKKTLKNPPTSTLKAEKANKGHENSIDPELGQKGQHGYS